jgi:hypothetical protein
LWTAASQAAVMVTEGSSPGPAGRIKPDLDMKSEFSLICLLTFGVTTFGHNIITAVSEVRSGVKLSVPLNVTDVIYGTI